MNDVIVTHFLPSREAVIRYITAPLLLQLRKIYFGTVHRSEKILNALKYRAKYCVILFQ